LGHARFGIYSCGHFSRPHHKALQRESMTARIARDREGSKSASSCSRDVSTETDAGLERPQTLAGGGPRGSGARPGEAVWSGRVVVEANEFSVVNDQTLRSDFLDAIQRESFDYFVHEANPLNGLIADKTQAGSPASIAAVGFALSSYPVGVERGFIPRTDAITRTLATLRFFHASVQGTDADATGHRGFYYHFLDMVSGKRVWICELSTIDSALLLAGMLAAADYFAGASADEREIRELADALYRRADWTWAQNGGVTVTHGWKPESGFLRYRWQGYDEAMILYLLGLGSPTHPLPVESWAQWTSTYDWRRIYDQELLYAGPLFIHQFSHI
jgi:hypothetical protein